MKWQKQVSKVRKDTKEQLNRVAQDQPSAVSDLSATIYTNGSEVDAIGAFGRNDAYAAVAADSFTLGNLTTEFEAILDCFVPMPELSNMAVDAVYVQLSGQLLVRSAVFFNIDFDSEGFADKRWNIPLQQLAENSSKGPDLGCGAIRLACRSQCHSIQH